MVLLKYLLYPHYYVGDRSHFIVVPTISSHTSIQRKLRARLHHKPPINDMHRAVALRAIIICSSVVAMQSISLLQPHIVCVFYNNNSHYTSHINSMLSDLSQHPDRQYDSSRRPIHRRVLPVTTYSRIHQVSEGPLKRLHGLLPWRPLQPYVFVFCSLNGRLCCLPFIYIPWLSTQKLHCLSYSHGHRDTLFHSDANWNERRIYYFICPSGDRQQTGIMIKFRSTRVVQLSPLLLKVSP